MTIQFGALPVFNTEQATFDAYVQDATGAPLTGRSLDTVQVNIGLKCNLACRHCHVNSSPKRTEEMSWETMEDVLRAASQAEAHTLDITGGAPEMHPHFRAFVDTAIDQGLHVMVRTNLTIMLQPGYETMADFLARRNVHLIASLPCYLPENVDKQRGRHVYTESINVLQRLNELGYGSHPAKHIDLVYNPIGAHLPPNQEELESAYRKVLLEEYGIRFNHLFVITNMAIGRFLQDLLKQGKAGEYQETLRNAFNPATLDGVMCRDQLHVGWDGTLYDCDFNYAITLRATTQEQHIREFDPTSFRNRRIATGEHCFACTAGCGSSCGGAIA
ncbi:MAG: arsenosugar biosynthesis radical SAM (seleno)protein ArsS [Candidatus Hydrogenedentota bacterium]